MNKKRMKRVLILTSTGQAYGVSIDMSDLKDLYRIIDTNVVQMVEVKGTKFKIWMDENGKLTNRPVNHAATELWGNPLDQIVGTVVVEA